MTTTVLHPAFAATYAAEQAAASHRRALEIRRARDARPDRTQPPARARRSGRVRLPRPSWSAHLAVR